MSMSRYASWSSLQRHYLDKYGRYSYDPGSYLSYSRYWPAASRYYYEDPVYSSRNWYTEPRRLALYRSLYGSTSDYGYRTRLYDSYRTLTDNEGLYYPRYSRYRKL